MFYFFSYNFIYKSNFKMWLLILSGAGVGSTAAGMTIFNSASSKKDGQDRSHSPKKQRKLKSKVSIRSLRIRQTEEEKRHKRHMCVESTIFFGYMLIFMSMSILQRRGKPSLAMLKANHLGEF